MPRKTFFKTYGPKSAKSSPESTAPPTTSMIPTPAMTSLTEAALEKANMAVLYDFTGAPKQALDAYNEAIALLDKVFDSTKDDIDQTRLRKIYDSYIGRVSILTQQCDNYELDPTPSISIPVAQLSSHEQEPILPEPSTVASAKTETKSQRRPPSLNIIDSPTLDLSYPATPRSLDPPSYLNSNNIHQDSLPPPPIPQKSQKPPPLPPKSPSGSLFGSMFLKKQTSKPQLKTPNSSHSIFSMSTPSKSTPTLSTNQPTISWKKQASKKKHRYSAELDPLDTKSLSFSCKIELPSLTLPDVETPKDDDYFDLKSTMETKNLLYSNPEPMLASMHDLHQKNTGNHNTTTNNNNQLGDRLVKSHGNAGSFHGKRDDTAATTKKATITTTTTTTTTSTTVKREQSFSSSSSSNTTTKLQPQLTSSASSTFTCNSSIYSPTASSFFSSTYTSIDEEAFSPVSNKHDLPPLPQSLLLPDINTDTSAPTCLFRSVNKQDVGTLTKLLAESAATMPGRSRRLNGTNTITTTSTTTSPPSIAPVIEETEPELLLLLSTTEPSVITESQHQPLSRSPSSKSISSMKSRLSPHRRSTSSKRNKKGDVHDTTTTTTSSKMSSPTPSPSNSAKAISFWPKRSTTSSSSKQKSIATLPPLCLNDNDNNYSTTDDFLSSWMLLSPPILSQPSTPKSMTSSIDQLAITATTTSPRTSSSSGKRPMIAVHPSQLPSHAFGSHATQTATNKGIDLSLTMTYSTMNQHNKQPTLMARLLQSMDQGGYITDRLHVPKQLWLQKQIRLPAMDAKLSTSDQLVTLLERMHAITRLLDHHHHPQQHDITTEALYVLGRLEGILDTIKQTFGKRHHYDSSPLPPPPLPPPAVPPKKEAEAAPATTTKDHSITTSWSGKFSKSVERIKIETKSSEEQIHAYRSTLIRLFTLASILERWRDIFTTLLTKVTMDKAYIYDHLLQKTMMCTGTFHTVICSFVMQDLYLLMDKWLKRNRDWLLD